MEALESLRSLPFQAIHNSHGPHCAKVVIRNEEAKVEIHEVDTENVDVSVYHQA